VGELTRAKNGYAADYETVVRLGKAIPPTVDMPSLLLQIDGAARGTRISFTQVTPGERAPAAPDGAASAAPGAPPAPPPPGGSGGAPQSGVTPADAQTSQDARGATGGAPATSTLDAVPLELAFSGDFFAVADFLHRQKRFVRVVGDRVLVRGRLMTVDSFHLAAAAQGSRRLSAEMSATVYLSPRTALPGPGAPASAPAASAPAAAAAGSQASNSAPPVAAVAR
jgi:hypothetical protein